MSDSYQRLHFPSSVVALSVPLIVAAIWIDSSESEAKIKSVFLLFLLFGANAVLTHAAARAQRIRQKGRLEVQGDDQEVEKVS